MGLKLFNSSYFIKDLTENTIFYKFIKALNIKISLQQNKDKGQNKCGIVNLLYQDTGLHFEFVFREKVIRCKTHV